ncbi:hypothetical protein RAS1_09150 [Phycisphaerae bacterium RAS1]|nr:hypothetical protein RAS1_09150 [Phycisphaerae bacterium RAS1]
MTRRTMLASTLGLVGSVAAVLGAVALAKPSAERTDCPGKIVCPLTGELVCEDRCPLGAQKADTTEDTAIPACCRAKGEKK